MSVYAQLSVKGSFVFNFYRPRSEASEGYVFTGVCHSVTDWGGGGGGQHQWSTTSPPGTRSEHLPPPPPGQVRTSTPSPRDQVRTSIPPPGPGQNIYPLPHTPETRSEHLPPPPLLGTRSEREYRQAGGTHPTGMHYFVYRNLVGI